MIMTVRGHKSGSAPSWKKTTATYGTVAFARCARGVRHLTWGKAKCRALVGVSEFKQLWTKTCTYRVPHTKVNLNSNTTKIVLQFRTVAMEVPQLG